MKSARIAANAAAAVIMGFFYGYFDYHIQAATGYHFMDTLFPWIAMFAMFVLPNALIHYHHIPLGLANAILGLSVEDAAYWFWARQLPASWAWFYPVMWHIPLDDILGAGIAAALYSLLYYSMARVNIERMQERQKGPAKTDDSAMLANRRGSPRKLHVYVMKFRTPVSAEDFLLAEKSTRACNGVPT